MTGFLAFHFCEVQWKLGEFKKWSCKPLLLRKMQQRHPSDFFPSKLRQEYLPIALIFKTYRGPLASNRCKFPPMEETSTKKGVDPYAPYISAHVLRSKNPEFTPTSLQHLTSQEALRSTLSLPTRSGSVPATTCVMKSGSVHL